jgi:hypothetical protein
LKHYYKVTKNLKSVIAQGSFCIAYAENEWIYAPRGKYGITIFDNIEHAVFYIKNSKLKGLELWECRAINVKSLAGKIANNKEFILTIDDEEWEAETTFPIGTLECESVLLTRKINMDLM